MLLSAVSVLVVAQSSSEIPEGLMNNPVLRCVSFLQTVVKRQSCPPWNGARCVYIIATIKQSPVSVLPYATVGFIWAARQDVYQAHPAIDQTAYMDVWKK